MAKVWVNGKSVRRSELTPEQVGMETALREDKMLAAQWYLRMSGQVEWKSGEKEEYQCRFDYLSAEIKTLQRGETVDWFSGLAAQ